ncbi:MAG: helix-turn-helix domain-containing protein [Chloroflexi bacterium]|nr:helix-turn-helix domain-containing protein [Chloroflexota bacterium]
MTKTFSNDWLSIQQASQYLGVHIGTVREWADAGILPSYRTPGGHRRFVIADLDVFLKQRKSPTTPSHIEQALGAVRQQLQAHPPHAVLGFSHTGAHPDTTERQHQREIGQRLLACVIAFVESPDARETLLDEGRQIARQYGNALTASGLTAGNAARATIYFRQLILKTVLDVHLGSRAGDEEDARLFQRVSAFLDEILLAILDAYP